MDARCTGDVCSVLANQTFEESIKCTLQQTVKDDVDGCELLRCPSPGIPHVLVCRLTTGVW